MRVPLLLFLSFFSASHAAQQAVTVKGIVNCRGHRQPGTFVQLYDEDSIPLFDDDDLLGSVIADYRGVFCVKGSTSEITTIEPYVLIEHNCGYEGLNEKRVFTRIVPSDYITDGEKAKHVYHMGDIELLTSDAPVQTYEKRVYVETSIDERIKQCIPIYVQYKQFYEKTVIEQGSSETAVILTADVEEVEEDEEEVTESPIVDGSTDIVVTEEEHVEKEVETVEEQKEDLKDEQKHIEEEQRRQEEERKRLEEERRRLEEEERIQEEQRRIEEERLRLEADRVREEQRRVEEEKQRLEQERREEERRIEEQRRIEDEKRREEETKLQEQRRKEQEDQHKKRMEEYYKREQERVESMRKREEEIKRREEERLKITASKETNRDPCIQYPVISQVHTVSRTLEARHEYIEDPCLRK